MKQCENCGEHHPGFLIAIPQKTGYLYFSCWHRNRRSEPPFPVLEDSPDKAMIFQHHQMAWETTNRLKEDGFDAYPLRATMPLTPAGRRLMDAMFQPVREELEAPEETQEETEDVELTEEEQEIAEEVRETLRGTIHHAAQLCMGLIRLHDRLSGEG